MTVADDIKTVVTCESQKRQHITAPIKNCVFSALYENIWFKKKSFSV